MNETQDLRGGLWENFSWRHASIVFLVLTGVLFADVLFTGEDILLSAKYLDLYAGEMSGLEYQLRELAQGHLPLWNPHVFSGTPNLSTPLYPSNLLGLVLPLAKAINWQIALHVFLIGFSMYLWASRRGLHPLASLASGVMVMFSGSFYLHIFAGHMGNLFAMAWVPLLFLAVDAILDRPSPGIVAGGALVAAMQILTGQYQYVYYTSLAVAVYVVFHIRFAPAGGRWKALIALCGIPAGAAVLTAFNLFPGLSAGAESVRSAGVSYEFASMFSLPPENLLTLAIPFLFGDMTSVPYWGRCYLWEMCLFTGTAGLVFAVYGAACGETEKRRHAPLMVLIMGGLALGVHTPLFPILYEWLPGFGSFRGTSKFAFQAVIFLALLSGVGLDRLIRRRTFPRRGILLVILAGAGLLAASFWLFHASSAGAGEGGLWLRLVQGVAGTGESYLPAPFYRNPAFVARAAGFAAWNVLIAAMVLLAAALLIRIAIKNFRAVYILLILILLEGFVFAWISRPVFHYRETRIPEFREFYAARPGDYRVLNRVLPNSAMSTESRDIWGYGPMVLKRYAEFMAVTQRVDPDKTSTYLPLHAYHPLWDLLRVRFIIMPAAEGMTVREMETGIPRVRLMTDWRVAETRNEVFALLTDPAFNPGNTVILEESPGIPESSPLPGGTCSIQDDGSDRWIVRARTDQPAILLIAENFSSGWRIEPLGQERQAPYKLMPADHTLMAVPLTPGEHAFAVRYLPRSFVAGVWFSAPAWILLVGWGLLVGFRRLRRGRSGRGA